MYGTAPSSEAPVITLKLPYVHQDVDRHGNVRIYFQRKFGKKTRIRERPGSKAFSLVYHKLLSQQPAKPAPRMAVADTYRWLCIQYLSSVAFRRLDQSTQRTRKRVLESTCDEKIRPDGPERFADFPLARLTTKALRVLRDRKADLPGAASDRVKAIRALFKWAMEQEHVVTNPARELTKLPLQGSGHHSWSVDEVKQFEARHALGSKARLAMSLLLWTGVRRSDVVLLGRQHVRDGWLKFTARKNHNRKPITVEMPLLAELQHVIEASPTGDMTYLMTDIGKPFTGAGFGNWFRDRCREAGLTDCSAHGLRKAGAATAAENGATTQQLMAIFGWLSMAEAERYTRAAERKRMAGAAVRSLVRRDNA